MFTGLIEEQGCVLEITDNELGITLKFSAQHILEDCHIGDSIAVNGVCLTVTSLTDNSFTIDAVPETMTRTNLGDLKIGDAVNLERAATPKTRLGGHYVQGHIDGTGRVSSIAQQGEALLLTIAVPSEWMRYIVEKGYITVDGTSLTVISTGPDWFSLTIIPHTQQIVTLSQRRPGERVNLEVDIIAKYVEKLISTAPPTAAPSSSTASMKG
ncbi:MAG: riboflavin synthase [bacterium]